MTKAIFKWKPASSPAVLKKYCKNLWREIIYNYDEHKCFLCGTTCEVKRLNAHHLISKKILEYAFNSRNGISLCSYCHSFSPYCSPHLASWCFEEALKERKPEQHAWWVDHRYIEKTSQITPNYVKIFFDLLITEWYGVFQNNEQFYPKFENSVDFNIIKQLIEAGQVSDPKNLTPKEIEKLIRHYKIKKNSRTD